MLRRLVLHPTCYFNEIPMLCFIYSNFYVEIAFFDSILEAELLEVVTPNYKFSPSFLCRMEILPCKNHALLQTFATFSLENQWETFDEDLCWNLWAKIISNFFQLVIPIGIDGNGWENAIICFLKVFTPLRRHVASLSKNWASELQPNLASLLDSVAIFSQARIQLSIENHSHDEEPLMLIWLLTVLVRWMLKKFWINRR